MKSLPLTPGVYLMKDSLGNIIYVGKAKQLKKRVQSYFQNSKTHPTKTKMLVKNIRDLDYIQTDTEFEAFMLECRLIKEIKPAYNRKMKNPKAYTYIVIRWDDGLRRMEISYSPDDDSISGLRFGPFSSRSTVERAVQGMKECLQLLCSSHPHVRNTPCLNHSLGLCMGVCLGGAAVAKYNDRMDRIIALLQGADTGLVEEMELRMLDAAERCDFEAAAKYRDYLSAVHFLIQKEKVIGFAEENKNIAILEFIQEHMFKLILIKGNRILYQEKYNTVQTGAELLSAKVQAIIRSSFHTTGAPMPTEVSRYDVDEAQIIYSYLKSSAASYIILPEEWLAPESDPALLEEAVDHLLNFRTAASEAAPGGQTEA